jgi:hypothetical protein
MRNGIVQVSKVLQIYKVDFGPPKHSARDSGDDGSAEADRKQPLHPHRKPKGWQQPWTLSGPSA